MDRLRRFLLGIALAAATAVPVLAQPNPSGGYAFLKAVRSRDGGAAQNALAATNNAVVNSRDPGSGETALHILVRGRDLDWLAFMLGRGARPDLPASDGTTPLGLAASIGWTDGAEQLLARGANVNLPNSRGETPLILAVNGRALDMIELLVRQGADPRRADSVAGYSALDYARRDQRNPAILRLLEAAPRRPQGQVVGPVRD